MALLSQEATQHFASVSRSSVVLCCLLEYLVPLFAPVSWCPKQNAPMCLAAAAAAIARHSWVLSSVRDEASRVFQMKWFLYLEKSRWRCNLPAQSCKKFRHGILCARILVLCLVLGLNWSTRRRPAEVSTCCGCVLFSASRDRRWVLLRLACPRVGWEVWRRWSVFFLCLLVLQR